MTIKEFLEERKKNNLLRKLQPAGFRKNGRIYFKNAEGPLPKKYYDFSSNDYLGFCGDEYLKDASQKAIVKLGTGAGASRLLSGDYDIHHQLEKETALFKGKESALIFNSGYQANVGIISSLYSKGDVIFSDRLNHASIYDGILLCGARFFRFRHNDMNHLEVLLKSHRGKFKKSAIITETVFSMDGDIPPLKEMISLKEKYNSWIMADEAHATGVFGKTGSGVLEKEGLINKVELIMGTFSKALGSFGAYLACSNEIKQYLINTCRSFIYSTALPPSVIAANLASLKLLKKEPHRRKTLLENADYFRSELKKSGFKKNQVKGRSQIVPLILGDCDKTVKLSEKLKNFGYWVLPIRPPTVSAGESRLRFSLTYHHTKEILSELVKCIEISKLP